MENMENVVSEEVATGTPNEPETTEKLFTQEQVNEIIKKRLRNQKEAAEVMQEVSARDAELTARESRLNCREYLMEKGYPAELLDIIDTADVEAFKNKVDKASGVFAKSQRSHFVAPLACTEPIMEDGVGRAFNNTKHTPKGYWPTDPRRKE